jgi:hypothetical protein
MQQLSNVSAMIALHGSWFNYSLTPRALMFARDTHKVVDLQSMRDLMRYNDYKHVRGHARAPHTRARFLLMPRAVAGSVVYVRVCTLPVLGRQRNLVPR